MQDLKFFTAGFCICLLLGTTCVDARHSAQTFSNNTNHFVKEAVEDVELAKQSLLLRQSAEAQCRLGLYDMALQDMEKAMLLNAEDAEAFYMKGKVYFAKMQAELHDSAAKTAYAVAAIEQLTQAIALDERRPAYYFAASLAYRYKGGISYAKKYFQAGMEQLEWAMKETTDGRWYLVRGIVFAIGEPQYTDKRAAQAQAGKDGKAAMERFDLALQKSPCDANLYRRRGVAKLLLNHVEAAGQDFSTAVQLNAEDESAWFLAGCCWSILGKTQEAERAFKTLRRIVPDWMSDGNNLTVRDLLLWYFINGDCNIKREI